MRDGITEIDLEVAQDILSDYPIVAAAYLFGSAARGELGPDSDVDFGLVLSDRRATAVDHYLMLGDIAGRLEKAAPGRIIDLVVLDPQGPLLRYAAVSDGVCFYEADRQRRVDFESETWTRYFDFKPTYDIFARDYLHNVRRALERERPR